MPRSCFLFRGSGQRGGYPSDGSRSAKPLERSAYEDSAHSCDVAALIDYGHLDVVDVIGFSMGCGTTARLLVLHPPQVKCAILAGIGDYALEDNVMEFPKSWPIPDSVPRPITRSVWSEEGARILEQGEIVPGHLASASLMFARATTGADPNRSLRLLRRRPPLHAIPADISSGCDSVLSRTMATPSITHPAVCHAARVSRSLREETSSHSRLVAFELSEAE